MFADYQNCRKFYQAFSRSSNS